MTITWKENKNHGGEHKPTEIIVHAMSEYINRMHASDFLNSIGLSAHYLVCPSGKIINCVNPAFVAYHAKRFNTGRIGIEVLVKGEHTYFQFLEKIKTDYVIPSQMLGNIELCNFLTDVFPIQSIKRHSDIDPTRKYDPGTGFDFEYLLKNVNL